MDEYCPGLGVGVEPEAAPDITYLNYNAREMRISHIALQTMLRERR